jgi:hypothetical protein
MLLRMHSGFGALLLAGQLDVYHWPAAVAACLMRGSVVPVGACF